MTSLPGFVSQQLGSRVLGRADSKLAAGDLDLGATRYGVGASWMAAASFDVDIDLQCVVVDQAGAIVDCAYYNNLKAAQGITHSGDEIEGRENHIEEVVWINTKKLNKDVVLLVFVIAAYSGGSLADIKDGRLHVMEQHEDSEIAVVEMDNSHKSVDVVAAMYKSRNEWKLRVLDVPAQDGKHFMDILPTLSKVIRTFLPHAPERHKVAFAMEKGGVFDFPADMGRIIVGLGWDVDDGECDLDVSAVLMDDAGNDLEAVFFGRLESREHGVYHTGDNLTGEGDDEQIICDMNRIGHRVNEIVFVVNIYSPGRTFRTVANPSCRVVDDSSGEELCRYSLREAGHDNGLIIAKLKREIGDRWSFHALGLPCRGRTYKDSLCQIRQSCNIKTSSLVSRNCIVQEQHSREDQRMYYEGQLLRNNNFVHTSPWARPEPLILKSSGMFGRGVSQTKFCSIM